MKLTRRRAEEDTALVTLVLRLPTLPTDELDEDASEGTILTHNRNKNDVYFDFVYEAVAEKFQKIGELDDADIQASVDVLGGDVLTDDAKKLKLVAAVGNLNALTTNSNPFSDLFSGRGML